MFSCRVNKAVRALALMMDASRCCLWLGVCVHVYSMWVCVCVFGWVFGDTHLPEEGVCVCVNTCVPVTDALWLSMLLSSLGIILTITP